MLTPSIYLDYQATTPVDYRVLDAMLPFFTQRFANSASAHHAAGRDAEQAVERARGQLARLVGATRGEILFLSGATEANNLALKGLTAGRSARRNLISLPTEHPAVLDTLASLERQGAGVQLISTDHEGRPDLDMLDAAVDSSTLVVSVATANNEIGTLPPLREIADIAHARGALLHTDAAQAVGKIDIDVDRDGIDLLSISAHKLYGPKGIGALYIRREHQGRLAPLLDGGGHERGLRSGTLNVPGAVGLGMAAEVAGEEIAKEAVQLAGLRDRFLEGLTSNLDGVEINGPRRGDRLPGNLNVLLPGVDADALIANCREVAFSAGSACSSATPAPSHVLVAIGRSTEEAEQSARFGFGRPTTADEVNCAVEMLAEAANRIRTRSRRPVATG